MATSPRSELRLIGLVVFACLGNGWVWAKQGPHAEVILDCAGRTFSSLKDAMADFMVYRDLSEAQHHYSKLVKVSDDEYHIRKYAYGAPDPFDMADPYALAEQGWVPEGAEHAVAG